MSRLTRAVVDKIIAEAKVTGRGADLSGADLYGMDLYGANLHGADLSGADLTSADLRGANLTSANLTSADLRGANLRDAYLRSANLYGANLYGANLRDAYLRSANLHGANLSRADLHGANLHGADLYGANLRGANLSGANLSRADLHGANLHGAELRGAYLDAKHILERLLPPQEGAFRAFKKVQLPGATAAVAVLEIPEEAQRLGGLTGRKCRASEALVLGFLALDGEPLTEENGAIAARPYMHGRDHIVYETGMSVTPKEAYCDDPRIECASGIHFFMTFEEARDF